MPYCIPVFYRNILKHFPQILNQQTLQNTFVIAKTYGHDCTVNGQDLLFDLKSLPSPRQQYGDIGGVCCAGCGVYSGCGSRHEVLPQEGKW